MQRLVAAVGAAACLASAVAAAQGTLRSWYQDFSPVSVTPK